MRGEQEIAIDYSGGLNLNAAPYLLAENQSRDCLNVHTTQEGQLRKRNGFTTHATLSAAPASFTVAPHTLVGTNVSAPLLVAVGAVSSADNQVAIAANGTVTNLTGGTALGASVRASIAQAPESSGGKGPIFFMNGVRPQEWDGNTANNFADWAADSGTVPLTGNYLVYHGDRLWCAELNVPGRVRYSGITGSVPDTGAWDANDFVDLEPEDGQDIRGIGLLGPELVVMKEHKIFVIYDLVTGANRQISETIGCLGHRTIKETPAGLMFWDERQGICVTDGNTVEPISENVDPLLRTAASFSATHHNAAATYWDDRYFLALSDDGNANNLTLEYDLKGKSWWLHECAANEWAILEGDTAMLFSANPNAITVQESFVADEFQDAGADYAGGSYWSTSHFVWGFPHVAKRVRQVRADGQGEWSLGYATDYSSDFTTEQGEVWFTTAEDPMLFAPAVSQSKLFAPTVSAGDEFAPISESVTSRRYYTLGRANAWGFKYLNDDSGDFQLYSSTVAINIRTD